MSWINPFVVLLLCVHNTKSKLLIKLQSIIIAHLDMPVSGCEWECVCLWCAALGNTDLQVYIVNVPILFSTLEHMFQ